MEDKTQGNAQSQAGSSETTLPKEFQAQFELSNDQLNKIKDKFKRDKEF
jgi:hypothetical protein